MIETIILDYLNAHIDTIRAYMQRPKEKPDRFIIIEITGQSKTENIYHSTVAIQSYGTSLQDAAMIDDLVDDVMDGITELDKISAVRLNSSYNFTDGSTGEYRYQSVFAITHY